MENNNTLSSPHPIIWIAGIAVTLLSIVGIASMTGLLPAKPSSSATPAPVVATAAPTPAAPVLPPASTETPPALAAPAPAVAAPTPAPPAVVHHKGVAKKKSEPAGEPTPTAMLPPPASAGVPPDYVPPPVAAAAPIPAPCPNCGVVADIRQVTREGHASGLGAVAGGVLGGALANNIGHGNGRALATIAGAVGGGMLGNKIEKSQHQTVSYRVSVQLEDGSTRSVETAEMPPWRVGDKVKLVNGAIAPR